MASSQSLGHYCGGTWAIYQWLAIARSVSGKTLSSELSPFGQRTKRPRYLNRKLRPYTKRALHLDISVSNLL